MAPKELESGIYIVSSKKDGVYVGRGLNEDMSLLPKAVLSLPPGVRAPFWIVEKLKDDHYRLKIEGAPTGVKDKHVFAFLMENDDKPEDWVIKHRDFHDAYTIERSSGNDGWILPSEKPYTQVAVGPLNAQPSAPPQYPLNELWNFVRIDRE
ncbi:hypothetical protein BD779DRAFT_1787957 [Infundibulicybe gibba]|nr:hypothetical protein BD779DRAFT_1787957 [Infundibulicybe gibba]